MSLSHNQETFSHHDGRYKGKGSLSLHTVSALISHMLGFSLVSHPLKEMAIPHFLGSSVHQFQVCQTGWITPSPLQIGAQSGEPEVHETLTELQSPHSQALVKAGMIFNPWSLMPQKVYLPIFLTHSRMMLYGLSCSIITNRVWVLAAADWIYKGAL